MNGPQKKCSQCRFWLFDAAEPRPESWGVKNAKERVGVCEEPQRRDKLPRKLRVFGAGGLCNRWDPIPASC